MGGVVDGDGSGVLKMHIHEVTRVTPAKSKSTPWTKKLTLPLTYFDIFWFKIPPVERLFFYEMSGGSDLFNSGTVPKLKHSLSLALRHYLPLAGRIIWPPGAPKPAVYYDEDLNGADIGVSFIVAESVVKNESHACTLSNRALFDHLTASPTDGEGNFIFREAVGFRPLVPELSIADDKAEVIAIQITLFPNHGFSIGFSSHHGILDGKSSTLFVKSWAFLCKQLLSSSSSSTGTAGGHGQEEEPCNCYLPPELTPFLDRSVIKDPKGQDMVLLNKWLLNNVTSSNKRSLKFSPIETSDNTNTVLSSSSNLVRATFELTRQDIKALRDQIASNNKSNKQLHLSTFVVTLAYAYACLAKAKTHDPGCESKKGILGFTADYRSRLDPPVPLNYLGNCVWGQGCIVKVSDLVQENGTAFAAELLSDAVKGINPEDISSDDADQFAEFMEVLKQGGLVFSVAGSTHFDVYGTDFGWGRPKKFEILSIDRTQAISLADSRDHGPGAVEIGVVLEKPQMEIFASLFAHGLKKV